MADSKTPIELLAPMGPCPVSETRPTFLWRSLGTPPLIRPTPTPPPGRTSRTEGTRWRLRLWVMTARSRVSTVMGRKPLMQENVDGSKSGLRFPRQAKPLDGGHAYLWQVERIDTRGRSLSTSEPGLFFVEDPALPIPLGQLLCCDDDALIDDDIAAWKPAYGDPKIDTKAEGCHDSMGVISLHGTVAEGQAVTQQLEPGNPIEAGKHYMVSFCARGRGRHRYARFRVTAHNGPLPTSGGHPPATANRVPVGETGRIGSGDWTWVVLPPFRAPRDFTRIAIAAIGDGDHVIAGKPVEVTGDISNICVREVDGCDGHFFPSGAGPELTFGDGVEIDLTDPPTAQQISAELGPMEALFGSPFGSDGSSAWYGPGDECASIGGWIPPDYTDEVPWHYPDADWPPPPDVVDKALEQVLVDLKDPSVVDDLDPIPYAPEECPDFDPAPFPREIRDGDVWADPPPPFAGRDIAFVHGFVPNQVMARIVADDPLIRAVYNAMPIPDVPVTGAEVDNVAKEWPTAPEAFADGGYFRDFAEGSYWANHIDEYLTKPEHPNRYMVGAYNCSQRLVYGVHAVLTQIAEAMNTGAGVRVPKDAKHGTECFGKELVIISHSTGALVTNVAMAVAARTADDEALKAIYGDISGIADRAVVHISMHGALGGSEGAQLAVAGAAIWGGMVVAGDIDTDLRILAMRTIAAVLFTDPDDQRSVDAFFLALQAVADTLVAAGLTIPQVVFASVLVDLSPLVTKTFWGSFVGGSPVPTLTLAGGHPSFGGAGPYVLKPVLPGLDDGVVSTNSQAGSDNLLSPDLYAPIPPKSRLFDMGLPLARSASFFLEQNRGSMATYGAIPYLSPSGMLQPVAAVLGPPRHLNVHPFLQATSEHSYTTNPNDPGMGTGSLLEEYVHSFGARNYEESLVLESSAPLDAGLVDPSIAGLVFRYERRLDLTVALVVQVPNITMFPPSFTWTTLRFSVTFPLWRRFYDLLRATGGPVTSTANIAVTATPSSLTVSNAPASPDAVEAALIGGENLGEMAYAYRYVLPV